MASNTQRKFRILLKAGHHLDILAQGVSEKDGFYYLLSDGKGLKQTLAIFNKDEVIGVLELEKLVIEASE